MKLPVSLRHPLAQLPARAHDTDAGFDLRSVEETVIEPGECKLVDTGVALALPPGTAGLLMARSGLAAKRQVALANGVGLIDAGFRQTVKAALINHGEDPFRVRVGERIAQLVVIEHAVPALHEVELLPEPEDERQGGFGSSGTS